MTVQQSQSPPAAGGQAAQPAAGRTDVPWPPLGQMYTEDDRQSLVIDGGVAVSEHWLRHHTPNLLAQWQDSPEPGAREQIARRIDDIGRLMQHAEFLESIGEDDCARYGQELRDSLVDGDDLFREVEAYRHRQRATAESGHEQARRLRTDAASLDVALDAHELDPASRDTEVHDLRSGPLIDVGVATSPRELGS
jgi:hypothetical protein